MKEYIIPKTTAKSIRWHKIFAICFCIAWLTPALALATATPFTKSWSLLLYRGNTAVQSFGDILLGKYNSHGERVYALELAYTLDEANPFRHFFKPIFDEVQIAGNIAYRDDYLHHDNTKEANLYIIWRFTDFPWKDSLHSSLAFGDGISLASHSPHADRKPEYPQEHFNRLLNYMLVEATVALPSHPEFELALRLHHRCTAWGTYAGKANAGSTVIGLGLRYYF